MLRLFQNSDDTILESSFTRYTQCQRWNDQNHLWRDDQGGPNSYGSCFFFPAYDMGLRSYFWVSHSVFDFVHVRVGAFGLTGRMDDRPILGGFLEHPATRFPIFSTQLWKEYPYLLPCVATASVSMLGFITTLFFVEDVSSTWTSVLQCQTDRSDIYRAGLQNTVSSLRLPTHMVHLNPSRGLHVPQALSPTKRMSLFCLNHLNSHRRSF